MPSLTRRVIDEVYERRNATISRKYTERQLKDLVQLDDRIKIAIQNLKQLLLFKQQLIKRYNYLCLEFNNDIYKNLNKDQKTAMRRHNMIESHRGFKNTESRKANISKEMQDIKLFIKRQLNEQIDYEKDGIETLKNDKRSALNLLANKGTLSSRG